MTELKPICCFEPCTPIDDVLKTTKWLYLIHLTSNQDNKATLYSLTFKVEGNKVTLFS